MRQLFVAYDTVGVLLIILFAAIVMHTYYFLRREHMVVQMIQDDTLLTFKEAMSYLRVSRSTLYRLMWSNQLTGHKVGSTWRFYREDLRACVGREVPMTMLQGNAAIS